MGKEKTEAVDMPFMSFGAYNAFKGGLDVRCPVCSGHGILKATKTEASFICESCSHNEKVSLMCVRCDVHNVCEQCGRYYRVDVVDPRQKHFNMLKVACPHCRHMMTGRVHRTVLAEYSYLPEIRAGRDPWLGLELWFLTWFKGKPVWAVNREHLNWLIEFIAADLRRPKNKYPLREQSDLLPTFMKTARNRDHIVKILKRMQGYS